MTESPTSAPPPPSHLPNSSERTYFKKPICHENYYMMAGVPREQKMLKEHLPRVIYHRVYFSLRR